MDKWEELKSRLDAELSWDVHYSLEKPVETNSIYKVKQWMIEMEKREERVKTLSEVVMNTHDETLKKLEDKPFLFTGVPTFDQKAWEKIMEQKGLQGLA